ncbi:uncharacterized protein LOC143034922 [Oratosquilla oratoria]|uniref:uncharacterized protein LOC143034922 n=1 Tax=Oratosquilla oratoria TaxID=337810 RepID=UPI003F76AA7A
MRLRFPAAVLLVVVVLAWQGGVARAQISLGPSGLQAAPINLLAVFKFLRQLWQAFNPQNIETAVAETKTSENEVVGNYLTGTNAEDADAEGDLIVEKIDRGCLEGDLNCVLGLENLDLGDYSLLDEKTGSAQVVAHKWPLIYVGLIGTLFFTLVWVATPYVLTGETYNQPEMRDDTQPAFNQQDALLLLTWLLGEALEDNSCLERIVCLSPHRSSRYLAVSRMAFKTARILNSVTDYVPYSSRFDDLFLDLEDVTVNGYSNECTPYYCSAFPNL